MNIERFVVYRANTFYGFNLDAPLKLYKRLTGLLSDNDLRNKLPRKKIDFQNIKSEYL